MKTVKDMRFQKGPWYSERLFEPPFADNWLNYLTVVCNRRGLQCSGISQIDLDENSGTYTISPPGATPQPELHVVWERKRQGPLSVRCQLSTPPAFDDALAKTILDEATSLCEAQHKEEFYCVGYIEYDGLPWRGEAWLQSGLRLGPPPQEYEDGLIGPRALLVEAMVEGIDLMDARSGFRVLLRELSAFLSVAMRKTFRVPSRSSKKRWVWDFDASGRAQYRVSQTGYSAAPPRNQLPLAAIDPPMPTYRAVRPDLESRGIGANQREQSVPDDLRDLWGRFTGLTAERRRQFLNVATMWQISGALAQDFETAAVAYLVAACEALKPADADRWANVYDVVEALLGSDIAEDLRSKWQPQRIRNAHFHAGELRGREFARFLMMDTLDDRTLHLVHERTWLVTAACIVEWLRRDGALAMKSALPVTWSQRLRRQKVVVAAFIFGGVCGWFLAYWT